MAFWRLQELAKPERWSARKLAAETGLAYTTVWGIWSGTAKRADLETIQKLADALGIHPKELIGSETPAASNQP
jgi:DNA-binding Xre family transcriptional regulator